MSAQDVMAQAVQPVAGCAAVLGEQAAAYDRRWLVIDAQGRWLTPQQASGLSQLQVELRFGYLVLRAPGMLRLDVPLDVLEDDDSVACVAEIGGAQVPVVDEGDLMAVWLSNFLQQPCRLVKRHPPEAAVAWPDRAA